MEEARKQFNTDQDFVMKVSNLTMLNKDDMLEFTSEQEERWEKF